MTRYSLFMIAAILLTASPAHATRTVTSPYVDQGALKLKWKGGATHDDENESRDGAWAQQLAAEYGVCEKISLESETYIQNAGDDDNTDITATSLKAKIQLTDKNAWWLDAGVRVNYEINLQDDPDSVEIKFLFAKDLEKFRHMANIIFDREVGEDSEDETNAGLSWSSRYKLSSAFEPGFEMYNNFGSISDRPDYEDQDHSIGPVAYGKLGEHVKYEAGYLAGFSENAADGRFKAVLEYNLKF